MPGFESQQHSELKERANNFFRGLGSNSILLEQKVIEGAFKHKVDVYDVENNYVAECGNKPNLGWIKELLNKANKVFWFGYMDQVCGYWKGGDGILQMCIIKEAKDEIFRLSKAVSVSKNNTIRIPKEFMDTLNITPNGSVLLKLESDGTVILKRVNKE